MASLIDLKRIGEIEFADIVKNSFLMEFKLRIILKDDSMIDAHLSRKLPDKFGFHWECMDTKGTIYRYDNFPDNNWRFVATYPYHFHNGSQDTVEASPFSLIPLEGFRNFMEFVRKKLKSEE